MQFFVRIRRYTELAMLLHWMVAAGIAFLFIHGFDMMRIPEAQRLVQLNMHRSVGVVVFALVLVRIAWRIAHPPPHVPMPKMQAWAASYVHILIYVLLVVNGIAGTVGWVASGDPVVFFSYAVAGARTASPELDHFCILVGMTTARILMVVIVLHVLAVVKHEWLDRDELLERMVPGPPTAVALRPRDIAQRVREWRSSRRAPRVAADKAASPTARE